MRLVLKLFLGFFLITGIAAFFVMRVFVNEVKPGVRQAMESTLVDAANVLAEMAAADVKAGTIGSGSFTRNLAKARQRDLKAMVWRFPKRSLDYRVTITDARGIVIYDSMGRDVGRDNSRWNDVYRTLRGEYGARSSPEVPGSEGDTVMHVAAPVYDPADGHTLIGVLSLAQPHRSIYPFIAASQRALLQRGALLSGLSALVGLLVFVTDVHSLGLKSTSRLLLTTSWDWNLDDKTRAFGKRFFEKTKRMPTDIQAANYSATMTYLKSGQATKTLDADKVMEYIKKTPIDDFYAKGVVRPDGRFVHDMYLMQVKTPAESTQPWDYYKVVTRLKGDEVFTTKAESKCALWK